MQLITVKIEKSDDTNFILGQTHFIKSVEDIHEALVGAVPGIKFGLAFCEASGRLAGRHGRHAGRRAREAPGEADRGEEISLDRPTLIAYHRIAEQYPHGSRLALPARLVCFSVRHTGIEQIAGPA